MNPEPNDKAASLRTHLLLIAPLLLILFSDPSHAHNVSPEDAALIGQGTGVQGQLFAALGAKHMVTGYDHLLFLLGVIFYLSRIRQVLAMVSLFALGHSITLIAGVLAEWNVSPYLVDAVIGLSVAYKGFDNLKGFDAAFGGRPNEMAAVFVFGLFHGLGLATKLRDLGLNQEGLLYNLVSFNIGVEIGQVAALVVITFILRKVPVLTQRPNFATAINLLLVMAGFALMTYQLGAFFMRT